MDFEILVWLAILLFFILGRLLGGKKKQPGRQQPDARREMPPREREADASLEDALQQIREALGGGPATEKSRPERSAPPAGGSRAEHRTQPRPATTRPERKRPDDSRQRRQEVPQKPKPSFHDTLTDKPQKAQRKQDTSRRRAKDPDPQPTGASPPGMEGVKPGETPVIDEVMSVYDRQATDRGEKRRDRIVGKLRQKDTLKEAFKLKEIIGPPRAQQPYDPFSRQ